MGLRPGAVRALPVQARGAKLQELADEAPLSLLALHPMTMRRAQRASFKTVGGLRAMNPAGFAGRFGQTKRREIYGRLLETGQAFRGTLPASEM